MESNKIFAAILLAALVASVTGFILEILEPHEGEHETAFFVEDASQNSQEVAEVIMVPIAERLAVADLENGRRQAAVCLSCHNFDEGGRNGTGPNLWNIIGSDIGRNDDFSYSATLTSLEGDWDYETLDSFLTNPRGYAPGTKMSYSGMHNDQKRANIIMYLRSLSNNPKALPEAAALEMPETIEVMEEAMGTAAEEANTGADAEFEVMGFQEIIDLHEAAEE